MRPAVFLDRDGLLNHLVYNPRTRAFESPHRPQDLKLKHGIGPALKRIQKKGFLLFVVSNQPSYALGKARLKDLRAIQRDLNAGLRQAGVRLRASYYCYHHPQGTVRPYARTCRCRKPSPWFLREAQRRFQLDLTRSWMVGDQDRDIECGRAAGVRTILVPDPRSAGKRGRSRPDHTERSLAQAAARILASA